MSSRQKAPGICARGTGMFPRTAGVPPRAAGKSRR